MAAVGVKYLTLVDAAQREAPDGKSYLPIAEVLHQMNPVVQEMPFMEGNLTTGHKHAVRTGIPSPTWRMAYGTVAPTRSEVAQVTDTCGNLEAYIEVDELIYDLAINKEELMLQESRAHLEGFAQTTATNVFYGDESTNPDRFTGLEPRFNSSSANSAENVVDASGSSALTSIWLVGWSPRTCFGIYPRGTSAGLEMDNKGKQTITDTSTSSTSPGGKREAYVVHMKQKVGLAVPDWRYIVRIANIDTSALNANFTGSSAEILDLMAQAVHRVPSMAGDLTWRWYMNRTIAEILDRQTLKETNIRFGTAEVQGEKIDTFRQVPIRVCDAITNAETAYS